MFDRRDTGTDTKIEVRKPIAKKWLEKGLERIGKDRHELHKLIFNEEIIAERFDSVSCCQIQKQKYAEGNPYKENSLERIWKSLGAIGRQLPIA